MTPWLGSIARTVVTHGPTDRGMRGCTCDLLRLSVAPNGSLFPVCTKKPSVPAGGASRGEPGRPEGSRAPSARGQGPPPPKARTRTAARASLAEIDNGDHRHHQERHRRGGGGMRPELDAVAAKAPDRRQARDTPPLAGRFIARALGQSGPRRSDQPEHLDSSQHDDHRTHRPCSHRHRHPPP